MPAQVDIEHEVPVLVGHAEQHAVAQHARVVDDDVQAAEMLDRRLHQRVRGGPLRDVTGHGKGFAPARFRECERFGTAQSGTCPGDDRGFTFETHLRITTWRMTSVPPCRSTPSALLMSSHPMRREIMPSRSSSPARQSFSMRPVSRCT